MARYVRLYQTAVDPADLEEMGRLFRDDVRPAFEDAAGCIELSLAVSLEKNAGGLVEAVVVSRWISLAEMEAAFASHAVKEGIVRFRGLLRQEPVVKVFELAE